MEQTILKEPFTPFVQAGFTADPEQLIPLLQWVQERDGYISHMAAKEISHFIGISQADVFTVASFFAQFRFHPTGQNHIRVCLGTACHVQGGGELSREIQSILKIRPGETTKDGRFDLEEVACLGCCAQAAVVELNGKIYAKMTPEKVRKLLEGYEQS